MWIIFCAVAFWFVFWFVLLRLLPKRWMLMRYQQHEVSVFHLCFGMAGMILLALYLSISAWLKLGFTCVHNDLLLRVVGFGQFPLLVILAMSIGPIYARKFWLTCLRHRR